MKEKVLKYRKVILEYEFGLPEGCFTCEGCRYCYADRYLNRAKCRITGEIIISPHACRGQACPLTITEEEFTHGKQNRTTGAQA